MILVWLRVPKGGGEYGVFRSLYRARALWGGGGERTNDRFLGHM